MKQYNSLFYGGMLFLPILTSCTQQQVKEKPLNIVYKSNLSKIVYIMI